MDVMKKVGLVAYDSFAARVMTSMQKGGGNGAPPASVGEVIFKAATDGSNKIRYQAGTNGVLLLRRLLPDGLFMSVIKRALLK